MPEQFTRCKFYDLNGIPIDGGCRFGERCRYIHPSDLLWNEAVPVRGRRNSDRFEGDRQRRKTSFDSHSRTRSDRDYPPSNKDNTEHVQNRSSDNPWSWMSESSGRKLSFDSGPPTDQLNSSTGDQGWGTTDSAWADTSGKSSSGGWGWGDNKNDSRGEGTSTQWGQDSWNSGGWGESRSESTAQRNSTSKPAALKSSFQTTDSAPNSPSILSTTPALSRLGKSSDQREVEFKRLPMNKASKDSISSTVMVTPNVSQDVEMRDATAFQASSTASAPTLKRARLPLPTRMKPAIPAVASVRDATENQSIPPSPVTPQDWARIPLSAFSRIQPDDMTSEGSTSTSALASLEPKELHSRLIKNIMRAVLVGYGLLKAEERKDKWRDARGSICYQHSTPAAQKILESTNKKLSEEILTLTKQSKTYMKEIVKYSDALDKRKNSLEGGVDRKKIYQYTGELRDWIAEVNLAKRIVYLKTMMDQETKEKEALKNGKQREVTGLKNTIYELEVQITDTEDDLLRLQEALPEHFREEYLAAEKVILGDNDSNDLHDVEGTFAKVGLGTDIFREVETKVKDMDCCALEDLPKVEDLQEQIKALEEEMVGLRKKDKEIIEFRKQADATLKKMQDQKAEDQARLDKLSELIEKLHSQPEPTPQPLPPIKPEDLAFHMDKLVAEYIATEIQPTLGAITDAVDAGSQQATAEFNRLVEQVVMKTYDLIQMAFKANGLIPYFVASPK